MYGIPQDFRLLPHTWIHFYSHIENYKTLMEMKDLLYTEVTDYKTQYCVNN